MIELTDPEIRKSKYFKAYYNENRTKILEKNRQWYAKNKDRINKSKKTPKKVLDKQKKEKIEKAAREEVIDIINSVSNINGTA
jgi:hypothetical protein